MQIKIKVVNNFCFNFFAVCTYFLLDTQGEWRSFTSFFIEDHILVPPLLKNAICITKPTSRRLSYTGLIKQQNKKKY